MTRCKGCGREMVWLSLGKGKGAVPLDPRAPVYDVTTGARSEGRYMVSHFATCPQANRFSGSGKKG